MRKHQDWATEARHFYDAYQHFHDYLDAYWECWHLLCLPSLEPKGAAMLRRIRHHLNDWMHC